MRSWFDRLYRRKIQREASRWQMRMLEPTSEREVEAFEQWLAVDPNHAPAYADMEIISQKSEHATRRHMSSSAAGIEFRPAHAFAAVLVLAATTALLLNIQFGKPVYAAVANSGPAVKMVELGDGSRMILDAGAEVGVLMTENERRIEVRAGRSRIEVRPNPRRPFIVSLPGGDISPTKGIIDVALERDTGRVTALTAGQDIRLRYQAGRSDAIRLDRGQTLLLERAGLQRVRTDPLTLRWPDARRAFDGTLLSELVVLANRNGTPPIVIKQTEVAGLEVSGVFDIRDTSVLARKLAAALDLEVEERSDRIILSR
jgi:transmembrane sensor